MNLINRLTEYFIDNQIISEESKNIYKYGFFVFFYNLFVIINIVIDGILLNEVYFTVVFLLFWIPYRVFIGGIHCSTATRCLCFFNLYYLCDLSLGEISDIKGISRQGVSDNIVKTRELLDDYEKKLNLLKIKRSLNDIAENVEDYDVRKKLLKVIGEL